MDMKRREFTQLTTGAALASATLLGTSVHAQASKPKAGTDYQVLDPRAAVEAGAGKIEVVEFFWYSCPHCNAFQDSFVPQQRLYFTLEAMGLVEKLHAKVFAAIHVEKKNLASGEAILEWVGQQGVDKAKFVQQYNSFTVVTKVTKATQLQNAYKVEGVPALGVAGRYYTDGSMAGNMQRALQVVDTLVPDVRAGR